MTARSLGVLLSAAMLVGAIGCTGSVKNMREVANVNTAAGAGDVVVVFLRPSGMGFAIQSSVFEIADGQPARLVGVIASKKKVAYRTTPGKHRFMVVGESADFMDSDLAPGKIYHALATVRMGMWKARFSLKPVKAAERGELANWLAETSWVEPTEDSYRWAKENAADIEAKRTEYLAEWMRKAPLDRPVLLPDDGQ